MIGRHSAIDKPEPVSRVTPPSTTIAKTRPQQMKSQRAMALLLIVLTDIDIHWRAILSVFD